MNFLIILLFPFVGFAGQAGDNRSPYPGVVRIQTSDGSAGTGFFISSDVLVTAFHGISSYRRNMKEPVKEHIYGS